MRYAKIVRRFDSAGKKRDGDGSVVGPSVRVCKSAGKSPEINLLGSLRLLYLVKKIGAGEFHFELENGAWTGDGLHATHAAFGRHRKKVSKKALSNVRIGCALQL